MVEDIRKNEEQEFNEAVEKTKPKMSEKIKKLPVSLFVILIIFAFFTYFQVYVSHNWAKEVYINKEVNGVMTQVKEYTMNPALKGLGVIVVVIFLIYMYGTGTVKAISEKEAKSILKREIKWKLDNDTGEFQRDSEFIQYIECGLPETTGIKGEKKYRGWFIHFGMRDRNGIITHYCAKIDCYTGQLIKYFPLPFGWDENAIKDWIRILIPDRRKTEDKKYAT